MALHYPYVFTRERSQRQAQDSALAIVDSQELFQVIHISQSPFYISFKFPTFDALVLLVSNPEQYHELFQRSYTSLKEGPTDLNTPD